MTVKRVLLGVVPVLLAACGGGAESDEAVRRYQTADTLVVDNLLPVLADTLVPRPVQRYGRAEGDPEYLFSEIFAFAVGPSGDVFVHDRGEGIRRFGADGAFLGRLAERGEGPTEVGHLSALEAGADGRVAALDLGNRRVTVFNGEGDAWSTRMPDGRPPYKDGSIVFTDESDVYVGFNPLYPDEGGISHPRPVFARVDTDGLLRDTVFTPREIATHCPELSERRYSAGFWDDQREPFVPKVKWALGPDGTLAVGCPATYHFYLYRPDGTVTRVARARRPVAVTREERDFRAGLGLTGAGETLPAYAKIRLTDDGRVWVWPSQPGVRVPLPQESVDLYGVTHTWSVPWTGAFDVFDPEGRWVAVVKLPDRARYSGFPTEPGVVIRGDTLWAVERDEYDVETVVRYVVEGLSGGVSGS